MTTKSTIGSSTSPRRMFAALLKPVAREHARGGCACGAGGGCARGPEGRKCGSAGGSCAGSAEGDTGGSEDGKAGRVEGGRPGSAGKGGVGNDSAGKGRAVESRCAGGCRAKNLTRCNREGMAACQAGNFDDAGKLLQEGIRLARNAGSSMYEAKLRNNLGLVHILAARPDEAAAEFGRALALVEGKLGRDNSLFRRIEGNLDRAAGA